MPLPRGTTVLLALSLPLGAGLAACAHELPPEPGAASVDTIPDVGPPERLTLNRGKDAAGVFTPDGAAIWYSWERLDRSDHDLCLGRLPVGGGTRTHEVCHAVPAANPDSVNWYIWAAPHPDGKRLAWFRIGALRSATEGGHGEVVLADIDRLDHPESFRSLSIFPIQVSGDSTIHFHLQPMELRWLDDSTLIYVGTLVTAFQANGLAQDTFYTGRELGTLTLSGDSARHGFVPGTNDANGLTLGPGGSIYFTRNGDERVYRTTRAGVVVDTVFDFGVAGYARDPVYVDGSLYAVVGGDVSYIFYTNVGYLQHDGGGELWRADTAGPARVDSTYRWRHPALSPDGQTLVIEGHTALSRVTDLFLLRIE